MKKSGWYRKSLNKCAAHGYVQGYGIGMSYNMVGSYFKGSLYEPPEYPEAEPEDFEIADKEDFCEYYIDQFAIEIAEIVEIQKIALKMIGYNPEQIGVKINGVQFVFNCKYEASEYGKDINTDETVFNTNVDELEIYDQQDFERSIPDDWVESLLEDANREGVDDDW